MNLFKIFLFMFFLVTVSFGEVKEVDKLFEKVNNSSDPKEKKQLIEELKKKLAQENIKKQEEADAILKAKEKLPNKPYKDISLSK